MADPLDAKRLEENLSALASRHPSLAASVRAAAADPRIVPLAARSGMIVPGVRSEAGTVPLHSLYDPRQESLRLAESVRGNGFYVLSGLGAGLHAVALLQQPDVRGILVIEKDPHVLRALFALVPLRPLLEDMRVTISAGLSSVRENLLAAWLPAVMGGMRTVPLRPWCELEKDFFDAAAEEVQRAVEMVRRDYSVQSHFGKRWAANILLNLARAESATLETARITSAAVTAAGPSLEMQLPRLAARRADVYLLATDASLPTLMSSGIRPDAVLSIDCQNHGYLHFMQGIPRETSLFLDLASPPLLARRQVPAVFVASAHPLVRYISSTWKRMVPIDTSGGNVAHAAVSLALDLGARRVEVYGADFCYPDGKAYARGTYIYDVFCADQFRLSPAETRFFSFVQGSTSAHRSVVGTRVLYTTPLLSGYRERFVDMMGSTNAEIVPVPGNGLDIPPQKRLESRPAVSGGDHPRGSDGPAGSHSRGWKEFLADYARSIEGLSSFSSGSPGDAGSLWRTILPVAARVVKEGADPGPGAMEEARRWTLERIARVAQASDGTPRS